MYRLKYCFTICSVVFLVTIIEIIRKSTNIPVTILDLLFFPFTIVFVISFFRCTLFDKRTIFHYNLIEPISFMKKLGIFMVSLLTMVLGLWGIWTGVREPLTCFSGVRGALHGYTIVPMGLFLFLIGAYGVLKSILIRFFKT